MRHLKPFAIVSTILSCLIGSAFADSLTLTESWKDISYSDVNGYTSKDTGSMTASLTIPGLSGITANDWSNLLVSISASSYLGSQFSSDVMSDAPFWGGTVTATSATFFYQESDVDFNYVNTEKITFTRSGNTLTISDQLLAPTTVQPPQSFLAENYISDSGPFTDSQTIDITVENDDLDNGSSLYVDIPKILFISGTNNLTFDAKDNPFANVSLTASANFTPPTVTQVSPASGSATTTGVLANQVKASGGQGIANVEFFWNGQDFGAGNLSTGTSNLWTQIFALRPGVNLLSTAATDPLGNNSTTNTAQVTYLNQTNASVLQFNEIYLDTAEVDSLGDTNFNFNQDSGTLNLALPVPGLQSVTTSTWTNSVLVVSFGDIDFSNRLAAADVLTPTSATFYVTDFDLNGNVIQVEQLTVSRFGGTLTLFKRTSNPSYSPDNTPIIADNYLETSGKILDQQPFSLQLLDGGSLTAFANISQTIYLAGTNIISHDSSGTELHNLQISGQADYIPPTVTITAPVSGQLWSNSTFNVAGRATDNIAVASVYYSLNNSDWTPVSSLSGTNWSTQVMLTPGTNTITAYSVDSNGNLSTTNRATVVYVVSAVLTVNQIGIGTITPSYNGDLLPIGKSLFMTAKAGTGFRFTGWTGSSSTNGTTILFTMASNLVFTANFADTNWPILSITNPIANQRISNAVYTVGGKASDNWQVGSVTYQLDNFGWTNAQSGNNWSNWAAILNPVPGSNTFQAYATDTSGNDSITNRVNFFYVTSALLQLQTTGLGKISPNYTNALLAVGQTYSITSAPASGFRFTNWVVTTNGIPGSGIVLRTNLQFMMVSNLSLLANFVDIAIPTVIITAPVANQKMPNAIANVIGRATDNWKVVGVWYQLNGGNWTTAPTTNNWTNWNTTLELTMGTNNLKAYALDLGGNYSQTNSLNFFSSNTFNLNLAFNSATPMLSNGLAFSLQTSAHLTGHIQYSTNLVNWATFTNFNGTNTTLNFRDPAATNSMQRFYRAAIP